MGRPKGSQNKEAVTVLQELQESKSDQNIKEVLLLIVDTLHEKDSDSATWKPIRDKIELL